MQRHRARARGARCLRARLRPSALQRSRDGGEGRRRLHRRDRSRRRDDRGRRDRARSARAPSANACCWPNARAAPLDATDLAAIGVAVAPLDGAASLAAKRTSGSPNPEMVARSIAATQRELDAIAKDLVMTNVHVVGATGYAAAELVRLLDAASRTSTSPRSRAAVRPARACAICSRRCRRSRSSARRAVPSRERVQGGRRRVPRRQPRSRARTRARACSPPGARVIDLSDAYRLIDRAEGAVYGLPERYRDQIAQQFVHRESRLLRHRIAARAHSARLARPIASRRSSSMRRAASPAPAAIPKCKRCSPKSAEDVWRLRARGPSPSARDRARSARRGHRCADRLLTARGAAQARHLRRRLSRAEGADRAR